MRSAWFLVALLLLSGCSSSASVHEAQGLADWAGFQEDAGPGGDLVQQKGRTLLQVSDFDLLLTLSTRMEWFEDGWRLQMEVVEAHFGGEDQSDEYAGLSVQFVCVPGTVAFVANGLEAFGRKNIDARAGHEADCLDSNDHNKVAAAFQQLAGRDFPLDGIEAMLALTVVPDVSFVSGREKGDTRSNVYAYDAAGAAVRLTAEVKRDRVRSLAIHAEADGVTMDSALAHAFGSRTASPNAS